MGVYIKGMAFPDNCAHCPYRKITYNQNDFYWISAVCCVRGRGYEEKKIYWGDSKGNMNYVLRGGRPEWCPLVEVTEPHGDLIDRGKLIADLHDTYLYEDMARKVIYRKVEEQKAVIESEGAKS